MGRNGQGLTFLFHHSSGGIRAVPTYEYHATSALQNFEVFQKFTEKPLRKHPECGGKVVKVFHPRGVIFKGSGFYVNDSRSKNGKDLREADQREVDQREVDEFKRQRE